jgi:hypothetical protein
MACSRSSRQDGFPVEFPVTVLASILELIPIKQGCLVALSFVKRGLLLLFRLQQLQ